MSRAEKHLDLVEPAGWRQYIPLSLHFHLQERVRGILTSDLRVQQHGLTTRVRVDKVGEIVNVRVNDDPEIVRLVVLHAACQCPETEYAVCTHLGDLVGRKHL